jgi:hypothetical protein
MEDITDLSTLKNLIPICANCKKVRDDDQYWHNLELYFTRHTGVDFSHGICPSCADELYPELRK